MYKDLKQCHTGTSHEACKTTSGVALDLHIILGTYFTESAGTFLYFASTGMYENYFFAVQFLGLFFRQL